MLLPLPSYENMRPKPVGRKPLEWQGKCRAAVEWAGGHCEMNSLQQREDSFKAIGGWGGLSLHGCILNVMQSSVKNMKKTLACHTT